MTDSIVRRARFGQLTGEQLYEILRLRVNVFVVEQNCPYPELDGRDTEPDTIHLWHERDGAIASYLRILAEAGDTVRIGRVCTAAAARGVGLAGQLLDEALVAIGPRPVALNAQSHLTGFYGRYGFCPNGAEYLEDGIPHTPMVRSRDRPSAT